MRVNFVNISETDVAIIRSVLKDCGKVIEALEATNSNDIDYHVELLIDIDRSIDMLKTK